jgi:hypothetical protein
VVPVAALVAAPVVAPAVPEVAAASYAVVTAIMQDYTAVRACIVIMPVTLMHLVDNKFRSLNLRAFRGCAKAASMPILSNCREAIAP